ncbi:MAG: hypothetical protein HDQ99_02375 [Lachnospiraceae bacterium]|nr:hypothetical protein [Lachnospiraceae bacterium]
MEKYIRLLGILLNISGVVSAFGKEYVLAVILAILGLISVIAASIESVIKAKEKTKQIEIEEIGKTERAKIVEEGHTERIRIITSESTQQLKTVSDTYNNISASMPPEELQKLNSSNVISYSEYIRNKSNDIMSEKHIEDEMTSYEITQNENDKSSNKENNSENDEDKKELLELSEKILEQFMKLKKDGSNGK